MLYNLFEFASCAREFESRQARFARQPGGERAETSRNRDWRVGRRGKNRKEKLEEK